MRVALLIATLAGIPILLGVLFAAFGSFGELLESLYSNDKTSWLKEGSPSFFTWSPPDENIGFDQLAGNVLSLKLIFHSPAWVNNLPNGPSLVHRLRVNVLLFWGLLVVGFVILILTTR
jgi:hypothetical protein